MSSDNRQDPCPMCGDLVISSPRALRVLEDQQCPTFFHISKFSDAGCTFCSAIVNALILYVPFKILVTDFVLILPQNSEEQDKIIQVEVATPSLPDFIRAGIEIFTTNSK